MARRILASLLLLAVVAAAASCAAAPAPRAAPSEPVSQAPAAAPAKPAAGETGSGTPNDTNRMVVQNVTTNLVVSDAQAALQNIQALASSLGGHVTDSQIWHEQDRARAKVTLRVPADKLGSALEQLHQLAVRVDNESTTSQDVTEEYTDLNAQLTNLEATEKELRALMTDVRERTQNAEEVLQVYRELTTVRGEIERVKGRMQYLDSLTAMATITAQLIPDALAIPVVEAGWRPAETLHSASRALVTTLQGAVEVGIWLVVLVVPTLLALAIPIVLLVLLVRWLARRRRPSGPRPGSPLQDASGS